MSTLICYKCLPYPKLKSALYLYVIIVQSFILRLDISGYPEMTILEEFEGNLVKTEEGTLRHLIAL